jgi:hypothetical protein
MLLCECGELVDRKTFKAYINTSINPSTPTIGHSECGLIFNFVDGKMPKRYSTKKELKKFALTIAEKNKMSDEEKCVFLLEVERLKSSGSLEDNKILVTALKNVVIKRREHQCRKH